MLVSMNFPGGMLMRFNLLRNLEERMFPSRLWGDPSSGISDSGVPRSISSISFSNRSGIVVVAQSDQPLFSVFSSRYRF